MEDRDRIAKLPVWAQDEIYRLERKLEEMTAHAEKLSAGPEDSNVRIRDYVYADRPLGRNVPVDFMLPDGYVQVSHSKHDDDALEIKVVGSGRKHSVSVTPQTSNSFKVRLAGF